MRNDSMLGKWDFFRLTNHMTIQIDEPHWVKIPGYVVIKLEPVYVSSGKLTAQGVAKVIKDSVQE